MKPADKLGEFMKQKLKTNEGMTSRRSQKQASLTPTEYEQFLAEVPESAVKQLLLCSNKLRPSEMRYLSVQDISYKNPDDG